MKLLEHTGKKHKIFIVVVLLIMSIVCVLDTMQQKNFRNARYGYMQMKSENYDSAAELFRKYLLSHDESSPYWYLMEKANGEDDPFTYTNVMAALSECEGKLKEK